MPIWGSPIELSVADAGSMAKGGGGRGVAVVSVADASSAAKAVAAELLVNAVGGRQACLGGILVKVGSRGVR